jgi:pyridoxine kinase
MMINSLSNATMQTIISIQSFVSYGHVGNSAVIFPLQRLGIQVVPINTVCFSNHTGYGQWQGIIFEPQVIRDIFSGIKQRIDLKQCDAMLTGYMGSSELGNVMLEIFAEIKVANPNVVYCCDPVMGDEGRGFFVQPGIPEYFRDQLTPKATIITPNMFELEFLSNCRIQKISDALKACQQIIAKGTEVVLTTSLRFVEDHEESIYLLAANKNQAYILKTPLLPLSVNGAGDLIAALFTAFYIKTHDIKQALEESTARVYAILSDTHKQGARELQLVHAQQALIMPEIVFTASSVV